MEIGKFLENVDMKVLDFYDGAATFCEDKLKIKRNYFDSAVGFGATGVLVTDYAVTGNIFPGAIFAPIPAIYGTLKLCGYKGSKIDFHSSKSSAAVKLLSGSLSTIGLVTMLTGVITKDPESIKTGLERLVEGITIGALVGISYNIRKDANREFTFEQSK